MLWSQLHAVALVEPEHLLLVVLFEVIDDEVSAVWNVLLFAAKSQSVVHYKPGLLYSLSTLLGLLGARLPRLDRVLLRGGHSWVALLEGKLQLSEVPSRLAGHEPSGLDLVEFHESAC